jgi:hypothetical protein
MHLYLSNTYSNNNITTFSPFPDMFYLPCADHVLLFVDDVVTCWPQTKISDWSEIKCIVILAVHNRTCSTQSVHRFRPEDRSTNPFQAILSYYDDWNVPWTAQKSLTVEYNIYSGNDSFESVKKRFLSKGESMMFEQYYHDCENM